MSDCQLVQFLLPCYVVCCLLFRLPNELQTTIMQQISSLTSVGLIFTVLDDSNRPNSLIWASLCNSKIIFVFDKNFSNQSIFQTSSTTNILITQRFLTGSTLFLCFASVPTSNCEYKEIVRITQPI